MSEKKKVVALIGANGMLAQMVRRIAPQEYQVLRFDLPELDITDRSAIDKTLSEIHPWAIVNCAAFTQVDACESQREVAYRVNGDGVGYLADAAIYNGSIFVHISTDYVFDGEKTHPYTEEDPVGPGSVYGMSKLKGERAILDSGIERYFIIRTSWLYGPGGKNFVETILRLASEREELRIVSDQVGTPTYTGDLAIAIFKLLGCAAAPYRPYGIYHFSNEGECSWHDFAEEIVQQARDNELELKVRSVHPIRTEEFPLPAPRPKYSVFSKDKIRRATGMDIPTWQESLGTYFKVRQKDIFELEGV